VIRVGPSARRSLAAIALGVGATSLGCGASSSEGSGVVATAEAATVELPPVSAPPEVGETVRQPLERSATVAIEAPKQPKSELPRECEEYLDRLTNCATLVPPQGRDAMLQAAQQAREAWLSVATDSNMFEALRAACVSGSDAFGKGSPCGP
jgi:hypothetical protein